MIGGSLANGSCRKEQEVLYDKNEATIEVGRNKEEGKQVEQLTELQYLIGGNFLLHLRIRH